MTTRRVAWRRSDEVETDEHWRRLISLPSLSHITPDARDDVDALYAAFMPLQVERVAQYSTLIPGALDVVGALRARGLKLGSCSGYPRIVMDKLLPHAAAQGLTLDHAVATDDLKPGGRPGPWMALANVIELGVDEIVTRAGATKPSLYRSQGRPGSGLPA